MELLVHLLPVLWRGGDVPGEALSETEVSVSLSPWPGKWGAPENTPCVFGLNLLGLQGQGSLLCGLWERKAAVVCRQWWGRGQENTLQWGR